MGENDGGQARENNESGRKIVSPCMMRYALLVGPDLSWLFGMRYGVEVHWRVREEHAARRLAACLQ